MKTYIQSLLIACLFFCGTTQSSAQSSHNVKVVGDSVDDANSDKPNSQSHTTRTILHTGNRGTTSATGSEGQPSGSANANQTPGAVDTSAQASGTNGASQNNSSTSVTSTTGSESTNSNCGHFCWGWLGLLGLLGLAGLIKRNPNK